VLSDATLRTRTVYGPSDTAVVSQVVRVEIDVTGVLEDRSGRTRS
jgi:hypothetical protein